MVWYAIVVCSSSWKQGTINSDESVLCARSPSQSTGPERNLLWFVLLAVVVPCLSWKVWHTLMPLRRLFAVVAVVLVFVVVSQSTRRVLLFFMCVCVCG